MDCLRREVATECGDCTKTSTLVQTLVKSENSLLVKNRAAEVHIGILE